ncbi:MAG: phosphodiester glycosidase family protein, partial [Saprospiraceae bacterium]|nr:phosphodiester glycosidase family protein [Saprospiraceae bacterium]
MKKTKLIIFLTFIVLLGAGLITLTSNKSKTDDRFITKIVDPKTDDIKLYWKDDKGEILKNIENLISFVENKQLTLLFAMNAGMYKKDFSPQGLFIQDQKTLNTLDTSSGNGNFYLMPNGVFYITTDNSAKVCKTSDFIDNGQVKYATQSGPMLVIDGKIHSAFKEGSKNLNIR